MFKIDPTANRISPLNAKRFSDLGFTERKHLQGWLEILTLTLAQCDFQRPVVIRSHFEHA